jgi:hypothetical protein
MVAFDDDDDEEVVVVVDVDTVFVVDFNNRGAAARVGDESIAEVLRRVEVEMPAADGESMGRGDVIVVASFFIFASLSLSLLLLLLSMFFLSILR